MARARSHHFAALAATVTLTAVACGSGDDVATPATTAAAPVTSTPVVTAAPATSVGTTTPATPPATSAPPTTAAATPPPVTTAPPADGNPFVGDEVAVTSQFFAAPFVMRRAAGADDLVAYDGLSDDGSFAFRCVAVFRAGERSWREWCNEPGFAGSFVIVDGIDPWLVDVGADLGDVTLTRQPFDWAVTSSGCDQPIVSIATAAALGPATVAGILCVDTEALLTYSAVFLQPGPADGGLALLSNGAEGWNLVNSGTSLDCDGYADGIDRCAIFGVDGELFGSLPMPSIGLAATQALAIQVTDATATVTGVAANAGATDVDAIVGAITASLTTDEPEATPVVTLRRGTGWGLDALVVEVLALDDSIRATVHHVWLDPGGDGRPAEIVRAYTWLQCARGIAGPGLCI